MMAHERLTYLLGRYAQQSLNAEERTELKGLLDDVNAAELPDDLIGALSGETNSSYILKQSDAEIDQALQAVFSIDKPDQSIVRPVHRIHFLRKWGWAAAAAAVFVICSLWFVVGRRGEKKPEIVQVPAVQDVAPGGNRAILTLADGTHITLDSAANGAIAQQSGVKLMKLRDGELVYSQESASAEPRGSREPIQYNTMSTPRGGQYQLTLPDGTKVWLNAASSITYPVVFNDKQRKVKITGEAYFEVSKNKEKPFIVDVDGRSEVEVLGTHFNINSYADEDAIRTTLLEGKVKVESAIGSRQSAILKPGEQAIASAHSPLTIDHSPDTSNVMAWKNGIFNFNGLGVRSVMAQLARWYDIDVRYEGPMPTNIFRGEMYRSAKLSFVLDGLREMGIKYKMDGKTVIVMQ